MSIPVKSAWTGPLVYYEVRQIDHKATGQAMRSLRMAHKISLRDIARRMGLSAPFVSDLERGRRNWDANRALLYMKAETEAFIAKIQKASNLAHLSDLRID